MARLVPRALVAAGVSGLVAVVAVAGIELAGSAGAQDGGHSSSVDVNQKDFRLRASVSTVRAGTVTFHVHNDGPSTHEFNVDRTAVADGSLPLRDDGITVNEDSPLLHRIDSLNGVTDGTDADLTVHLTPGRYVLYCNFEGHYLGGMHFSLTVR
jgi:uncharacterized cupredoxin-like copper-binding protein